MPTITLPRLALALLPVALVLVVLFRWRLGVGRSLYALARMLTQLLLIGFVLVWLFEATTPWPVLAVLVVMLVVSSWIALGNLRGQDRAALGHALWAIGVGGGLTLATILLGVLDLDPWYTPRYAIPLAGMVFANAMNTVSLAGERLEAELGRSVEPEAARATALRASLIPITNSLFAVGLVSLPGMMTGQILSGVSPFVAARYQIMVMCMIFGAGGLAAAIFLALRTRGTVRP